MFLHQPEPRADGKEWERWDWGGEELLATELPVI